MQFYQEITEWAGDIVNGVYLLDDSKSKMFAYVQPGSDVVKTFKKPIQIDTRGRKFRPVKNTFGYQIEEKSTNPRWEIQGSRGDKYIVERTENGLTCTCSGFKFRARCRHLTEIK